MKKNFVLILIPAVVFVFACTLPSSIEVKGNPKLRFSANMDLGNMLIGSIEDALRDSGDLEAFKCTQTTNQTFVIYNEIFEESINIASVLGGSFSGDIQNPSEITLHSATSQKLDLDLSGAKEELFKNFNLKSVKSKLLISGSGLVEIVKIDFTISGKTKTGNNFEQNGGFAADQWIHKTTLPNVGLEFDLTEDIKNDEIPQVYYEIILPKDVVVPSALLTVEQTIKAELVIWLPLEFEADTGGADLKFPGDFLGGKDDLFGRRAADEEGSLTAMIKSLDLIIEMNKSPFEGALLIVNSAAGPFKIMNTLQGNSLDIPFNAADMEKINSLDYYPFTPAFTIHFDEGQTLAFPREFRTTAFCFDAVIDFIISLDKL
jgi:hypothetical protein